MRKRRVTRKSKSAAIFFLRYLSSCARALMAARLSFCAPLPLSIATRTRCNKMAEKLDGNVRRKVSEKSGLRNDNLRRRGSLYRWRSFCFVCPSFFWKLFYREMALYVYNGFCINLNKFSDCSSYFLFEKWRGYHRCWTNIYVEKV